MSLSKKTRFEIFKRDGFTCQYCGQQPPAVKLEVDHIDPKANGGSDIEINLITSCFDCNRGKSDRKLGDVHPRPDADLKALKVQQEIAEAQFYLKNHKELTDLRKQIIQHLLDLWEELVEKKWVPAESFWSGWLSEFSPEEIEYAIRRTAPKYHIGQFGNWNDPQQRVGFAARYVWGVLRSVRKEQKSEVA